MQRCLSDLVIITIYNNAYELRKKVNWQELEDGYDKYKAYIRSKEWDDVKEKVLEHYGHKCMFCGRTEEEGAKLIVHHSKYEGVLYEELEHINYVIPLCQTCHLAGHRVKSNYCRFKKPKKAN